MNLLLATNQPAVRDETTGILSISMVLPGPGIVLYYSGI